MDEIRPWLYIGKYRDTLDKDNLETESIKAMLQLAEYVEQKGVSSLYLPVEDLAPLRIEHIKMGIEFIKENYHKRYHILIACGAGINRSTAFCIIALKEIEGLGLFEAYQNIKLHHSDAFPHEPLWNSLCNYYEEPVPYINVIRLNAYK
ncbi:MAG: dual specificity protein phosphatase [Anaerolineales bacterium]